MDQNFDVFVERVLLHEGGYSNNPRDPGGETNFGVTRRFAWKWGYRKDMKTMSRDQAKDLYKVGIWYHYELPAFSPIIGFQAFDAFINHSPTRVIRWLQQCTLVEDDGIIGKITLESLRKSDPVAVSEEFLNKREDYFKKHPDLPLFPGWLTRVKLNRAYREEDIKRFL